MQPTERTAHARENNPAVNETLSDAEFDKSFTPKGAIAFFVILITIGAIIWYGIYLLMLERV